MLAPHEEICLDFMEFKGKDILVLKDRILGYLYAKITKNKPTASATKFLMTYLNLFGLPHRVTSDGGPAFRDSFTSFLRGHDVLHHPTSAHRPQSNGLVECGVRSLRDVLAKLD